MSTEQLTMLCIHWSCPFYRVDTKVSPAAYNYWLSLTLLLLYSSIDRPGSQNSGTGLRRKSSSQPAVDPLQFVALKPAEHLAQKAVKQLELALETRKKRESVDKDEAEWQFVSLSGIFSICSVNLLIITQYW